MTIDRTPKPCRHKVANHQHGQRTAYVLDRCRCLPCAYAASVYELDRSKRNAYGRSNYIDADPVRAHVAALTAAGIGLKTIVKRSGVPQGVLWKLVYGKKRPDGTKTPSRRVTKATAEKLLALDPTDATLLADGAKVDPTGVARRLQALACLGWSVNRLAADSGIDRQVLDQALHGKQITAGHTRAIAALYDRLWDQQPPATNQRERISVSRTLNRATTAGWAPPMAWNDDTIDDVGAKPTMEGAAQVDDIDEHAIELVLDGQPMTLTGRDLEMAIERLTARGLAAATIAHRVRSDETTVRRIRNTVQQRNARRAARAEAAA